jgi:hypothetical protein
MDSSIKNSSWKHCPRSFPFVCLLDEFEAFFAGKVSPDLDEGWVMD